MKKQFAIIAAALFAGFLFFGQVIAQTTQSQDAKKLQSGTTIPKKVGMMQGWL